MTTIDPAILLALLQRIEWEGCADGADPYERGGPACPDCEAERDRGGAHLASCDLNRILRELKGA